MSKTISAQDRIVVVMGPTGSGKSTFIECATHQDNRTIGHKLVSFTEDIRAVRTTHPTKGYPVVFADTPGFDDTTKSDVEILSMIADWLVRTYKGNCNIASILYLYRITDNRVTGSVLKNLRIFAKVCGQKTMPNVILVTTMWGKLVDKEEGEQREAELKGDFWGDMVACGCKTARFDKTDKSAWRIVDSLAGKDRAKVLLSTEMVDDKLQLPETQAGIALNKELEKLIRDRQRAVHKLARQVKQYPNDLEIQELNQQTAAEIEDKIRKTADQLRKMKVPFTRKVRLFSCPDVIRNFT